MTQDFVLETILILFVIFYLGVLLGQFLGRRAFEEKLLADEEEETSSLIGGAFYRIVPTGEWHSLQIAKMRCERQDRKHKAISELVEY